MRVRAARDLRVRPTRMTLEICAETAPRGRPAPYPYLAVCSSFSCRPPTPVILRFL